MQACEDGNMGPGTILGIAVPLLQQAIVEGVCNRPTAVDFFALCVSRTY